MCSIKLEIFTCFSQLNISMTLSNETSQSLHTKPNEILLYVEYLMQPGTQAAFSEYST